MGELHPLLPIKKAIGSIEQYVFIKDGGIKIK